MALFLGPGLGQPDGCDLRLAIGAAGDRVRLDRVRMAARDQFGDHDAFVAGLVRQPGRPRHIADGKQAIDARAAIFVGHDMAAIDLDAGLFQAQPLDIADNADGGNHRVEIDRLGLAVLLDMGGDLVLGPVQFRDRRLFHDGHALLFEGFPGKGGDLGILDRQNAVHHLDHGGITPQRVEEAGEFDADGARSDDQQLFRHMRRLQCVLVVPDQLAIRFQPRQFAGPRAGRDDDRPGRDLFAALVGLDRHLAFAGQPGLAHDGCDLVLLEQMPDTARQLLGHPARTIDDLVQVIADPFGAETEILGAFHQVKDLGAAQQGLGRDAAPVQADAAQMLAFDTGHLQPQLRAPDRRDIAARPRTDHHHVEILGHWFPPLGQDGSALNQSPGSGKHRPRSQAAGGGASCASAWPEDCASSRAAPTTSCVLPGVMTA